MHSKRAALELSVGTIVVLVLGVTMLIIGMVLVRNIMCGALGLTSDINSKVRGEITRLFGSSQGEIECIGAVGDAVQMVPGQLNSAYCGINAEQAADYEINVISLEAEDASNQEVQSWTRGGLGWKGRVAPGDSEPKRIVRFDLPNDAAEGLLTTKIEIKRNGQLISTKELDFDIKRVGLVKSTVC
ncbi:MAG: hypothetical protein AABX12_00825 [Nanoarchaeota archaeon]